MRVESLESRVESQKSVLALRFDSRYATRVYRFFNVCIEIPKSLAPSPQSRRSAMTLVELLVVIIIMTVIVAAAIPLMSPSNDDRRLREAARGLNTYITGAQARAISLNRPVGVALKRLSQDTNTDSQKDIKPTKDVHPDNSICLEVFYVEQQPPYAGFDPNSRACVALHPKQPGLVVVRFVTRGSAYDRPTDGLPDGWDSDLFPSGTIRPGDVIQINGTRFELLANIDQYSRVRVNNGYFEDPAQSPNGGPPNSPRPVKILARPINDSGQQINPRHDNLGSELTTKSPAPYWTLPSPYKVLRQPTPMADEAYQLPEGTAIDLRASGVGSGDYFYVQGVHDDPTFDGVLIMFAPEGRVSRVTFSQLPGNTNQPSFDQSVVDNVFLL